MSLLIWLSFKCDHLLLLIVSREDAISSLLTLYYQASLFMLLGANHLLTVL